MKVRPRYLTSISEDLTVLDLVVPATEEDYEMAVAYHLPALAVVGWRLKSGPRKVLRQLRRSYKAGNADPDSVKDHLLRMALPKVQERMREKQTVRFGRSWRKDRKGRQLVIRPSRDLGHIRDSDSDVFCLAPWPTADDVDAFTRWIEQALFREVVRLLDERVDLLDGPRLNLSVAREDALARVVKTSGDWVETLAQPTELDDSPDPEVVTRLQSEYRTAMDDVARLDVEAEDLKALGDIMGSIHSGDRAWARRNTLRKARLEIKLRRIALQHPESVRHVHAAWRAAKSLGELGEPLPLDTAA